jgi:putative glutamine amidotransferase
MANRIGLTMRVTSSESYDEPRDALAQNWAAFMAAALPEAIWLPLPNLGPRIVDFVRVWQLDGFILTGGNDVGKCPSRDETESALLNLALERRAPVLGVCRGLQFIQCHFGGPIANCAREIHVGKRHPVTLTRAGGRWPLGSGVREVNSFHGQTAPARQLAPPLELLAASDDGCAEAFAHSDARVVAVQWHPERCVPCDPADRTLIRQLFLGHV